jgi:hypothetical protein
MAEVTLSGNRPESSLQVWSQLVASLQQSGFREAGPEYLKLSRLVADTRRFELLRTGSAADELAWERLREVGAVAHALLAPLAEAARILAELPMQATVVAEVAKAVAPPPAAKKATKRPSPKRPSPKKAKKAKPKSLRKQRKPLSKEN